MNETKKNNGTHVLITRCRQAFKTRTEEKHIWKCLLGEKRYFGLVLHLWVTFAAFFLKKHKQHGHND